MKTAMILITILGCDDKVSQCEFYATPPERFVSVALCDAASESVLERYGDIGYPTAVAVCQAPDAQQTASPVASPETVTPQAATTGPAAPPTEEAHKTLAARAVERISQVLPGTSDIKMIFETPIHVVSDSYSWVAKKIIR